MEEELETGELKENLDDNVEHAEHAGHGGKATGRKPGPSWMQYLSLSTAMLAVFAAVTALLSGHYSNDAILQKSEAADEWAEYQAQRIKLAIAQNQAQLLAAQPAAVEQAKASAARYERESQDVRKDAAAHDEESAHMMSKHQGFAITVTLLQIAIALAAIGALTRRRHMWFLSLGLTGASVVTFVIGALA
jgi:hypothetical protein